MPVPLGDGKGDELGDPHCVGDGPVDDGARDAPGIPLAQGLNAMPQNGPWKRPAEFPPAFAAHEFANDCQSAKCAVSL